MKKELLKELIKDLLADIWFLTLLILYGCGCLFLGYVAEKLGGIRGWVIELTHIVLLGLLVVRVGLKLASMKTPPPTPPSV